jgi:hypothetical protein
MGKDYSNQLEEKHREHENICVSCGECCGSLDDPCHNLEKKSDGTYSCKDYENRLGPQITVGGNKFTCVEIREHIAHQSLRNSCTYRKRDI